MPLCSDRAATARNLFGKCDVKQPSQLVSSTHHDSRAKVEIPRDDTGANGEAPRHHLVAGRLRKVLGSAPAPGGNVDTQPAAGSTVPGPAETWLPAGVSGNHKIRGSAMQCRLTWRARAAAGPDHRRAVSLSLGLHARGIVHDRRARAARSRRPCYGRRTDCARRCRSGWTAVCYVQAPARGALLSVGSAPARVGGDGAAACRHRTEW